MLPARFYYLRKLAKEAGRDEPGLAVLYDIVRAGFTAIDVGANRGYNGYALLQIASYVDAFGPNSELADFAADNLGANVRSNKPPFRSAKARGRCICPQAGKAPSLHLLGKLGQIHPSRRPPRSKSAL